MGKSICFKEIEVADTYWRRLKGLEGVSELKDGYGLFFPKCSSIHMFGMKISLDIVYLDKDYQIVGIETLSPWKIGHAPHGTVGVLETKSGMMNVMNARIGDVVDVGASMNHKKGHTTPFCTH